MMLSPQPYLISYCTHRSQFQFEISLMLCYGIFADDNFPAAVHFFSTYSHLYLYWDSVFSLDAFNNKLFKHLIGFYKAKSYTIESKFCYSNCRVSCALDTEFWLTHSIVLSVQRMVGDVKLNTAIDHHASVH